MFNFNKVDRFQFKRHFILNANLELRFTTLTNVDWEKVKLDIEPSFGIGTRASFLHTADISLPPLNSENVKVTSKKIGIQIVNEIEAYAIAIQADRWTFTSQKYQDFEKFWSQCQKFINNLQSKFPIQEFTWLGIRKINNIKFQPDDGEYRGEGFNESIFSSVKSGFFNSKSLKLGEQNFILNENSTNAIIRNKFTQNNDQTYSVIIDLDLNKSNISLKTTDEIFKEAKNLNDTLFSLFCWVTAPSLLDEMKKGLINMGQYIGLINKNVQNVGISKSRYQPNRGYGVRGSISQTHVKSFDNINKVVAPTSPFNSFRIEHLIPSFNSTGIATYQLNEELELGFQDIELLKVGWNSYNAKAPKLETINQAKDICKSLPFSNQPSISPETDGSIGLYWDFQNVTITWYINSDTSNEIINVEFIDGRTIELNGEFESLKNILSKIISDYRDN